jgi:RimJ/RimL family protein N-acetyltransferase
LLSIITQADGGAGPRDAICDREHLIHLIVDRFVMQLTFETNRLLIRPRMLADTDACLAMDSEPEVTRFIPGPWSDPVEHRAFIEARTRGPYPPGLGYWAVLGKDTPSIPSESGLAVFEKNDAETNGDAGHSPAGQGGTSLAGFIGWVVLMPADAVGPEIEIGWRLRREAWGLGLATEAARPLLHHAFAVLKLAEVVADINPGNARSLRVAEKLGFRQGKIRPYHGQTVLRCALRLDEL